MRAMSSFDQLRVTQPASLDGLSAADAEKPSLLGATRSGIAEACRSIGVPEREIKMRVAQLWHWIYFQGATSFDVMANIGKTLRTALAENFSLPRPQLVTE